MPEPAPPLLLMPEPPCALGVEPALPELDGVVPALPELLGLLPLVAPLPEPPPVEGWFICMLPLVFPSPSRESPAAGSLAQPAVKPNASSAAAQPFESQPNMNSSRRGNAH
jgi:hypothetical protein